MGPEIQTLVKCLCELFCTSGWKTIPKLSIYVKYIVPL